MSTKQLVLFICLIVFVLFLRFLLYKEIPQKVGENITLEKTLLTQPKIKGSTQQFLIDDIWIVTSRFPEYSYGETLKISGTLKARATNKNHPILMLYFPKIERVQNQQQFGLAIMLFLRQRMVNFLQNTLPATPAGLLAGIVLGGNQDIDKDFLDSLRISGTLHVIAASGMNVSMVASFLIILFRKIFRRQIGLLFVILGIICYAALAGFTPSIVRASIMGGLLVFSQILGRQSLPLFALFLTGFIMLFIDPKLILDIGFQLSFLATAGLILIKPLLDSLISLGKLDFITEQITTTLAAQAATVPILLANFGTFSLLSVFANAMVLWMVPTLMVIGALSLLLSFLLAPVAALIVRLTLPFLWLFEGVVRFFAKLPGVLTVEELPFLIGFGYYLILVSIVLLSQKRKA